jgi:hypothetical protein
LFVQCDDVVQDCPAATSDPALRYSILPGRADARPLGLQTSRLQERDDLMVELRVPIQNHVAVRASFGKGLAELLDHPLRSRMAGHIAVKDLPASVGDYKEAVKQLEGHRRHREEVHGNDDFAVVLEERKPLSARVPPATDPRKIPGYAAFRHDEAELLQLAVDLGSSPNLGSLPPGFESGCGFRR